MSILIGITNASFSQNDINETLRIIKNRQQYPNYFLVAGHRGYWMDYPENTKEAYNMAIQLGVDIVEMDVRLTSDSVIVVMHDACLSRVTTGYGLLSQSTWSYVSSLNLRLLDGTPTTYKMLKLTDALDFLKNKAIVSIDIKETGALFDWTMIKSIEMVKSKGMLSQTIIKGKSTLADLQENVLNKTGTTLSDFIYTPIAFPNTKNLDSYIKDFVNTKKIYAIELVYKKSNDPILSYVSYLNQNNIWVGQYSFWPETRYGVFAEKIPLTDCDPITRDYNFLDTTTDFLDLAICTGSISPFAILIRRLFQVRLNKNSGFSSSFISSICVSSFFIIGCCLVV